jgi:hypothetical protein
MGLEYLPRMHKALGSISSTMEKKRKERRRRRKRRVRNLKKQLIGTI